MKHLQRKILALALALVLILPVFSGCSSIQKDSAVTYGSGEITKAIFQYLCCTEKTNYLYEAYGLDPNTYSASQLQDNAAIWSAKASDGTSVANNLKSQVLEKVQIYLYMQQHAKNKGYTLSAEQKKTIQKEFDKTIATFETKKAFNEHMAQYGVDYDQILAFQQMQSLAWQGNELLFGEGGSMEITTDSAKRYFEKNYISVSSIFINTKNKTYPNGKVVVLPDGEKEEKEALAKDLFARLEQGEEMGALAAEYSDASGKTWEYTFQKGGFVNSQAEEKAFEMKPGEILSVETSQGVYLIRRENLDQGHFESKSESICETLEQMKKISLILEVSEDFEMDEEFLNGLDIAALPHLV